MPRRSELGFLRRLAGWTLSVAAIATALASTYAVSGHAESCGSDEGTQCGARETISALGIAACLPMVIGAGFAGALWPLAAVPLAGGVGFLFYASRNPGNAAAETWIGIALVLAGAVTAVRLWRAAHEDLLQVRFMRKAVRVHGTITELEYLGRAEPAGRHKERYRIALEYVDREAQGTRALLVRVVTVPDDVRLTRGAEAAVWYGRARLNKTRTVIVLDSESAGSG